MERVLRAWLQHHLHAERVAAVDADIDAPELFAVLSDAQQMISFPRLEAAEAALASPEVRDVVSYADLLGPVRACA